MHNIVLVCFDITMLVGKTILRAFQGFLPWEDLGGPEKDREFLGELGLLLSVFDFFLGAIFLSQHGVPNCFIVLPGQGTTGNLELL